MTKQANADLNLFIEKEFKLGPGGKPGRLYREQQRLHQLRELFQGPRSLKIAHRSDPQAPEWWKTGWKSEDEAREFLKKNPDIHKELFPEVKI